jgi:hypothetical protein
MLILAILVGISLTLSIISAISLRAAYRAYTSLVKLTQAIGHEVNEHKTHVETRIDGINALYSKRLTDAESTLNQLKMAKLR